MVYLKTTPYTTAATSLMNVFNKKIEGYKATQQEEFSIWQRSVALPTRASSIFGLALIAKEKGLNPTIYAEGDEFDFPDYRFHRYKKSDIEFAQISSDLYKQECLKKKIPINIEDISFEKIKELLKTNYLIVRINTKFIRDLKRNNSNYLLFEKYENNVFRIIDPKQGELDVDEKTALQSYISLETKKHRLHKVLCISKK